ncbi:mitochondrial phosphate carrier protein 1, mitochondrial isoform X3 [Quercus lobata]|uniref:mitochondrial phosphate carrier protein 1, mitochondrial isoform X3 n=1 Tax=Quercus lobata TaxID=97700 RepID=UPI001248211B|nr:mitochondrial phosphate carrier protein 1, mitochondrial isoform X3 [Quercus lobata]
MRGGGGGGGGQGVERRVCEEFSPGYYALCTFGGMLSAGTTHLAITPLDVLKVNMQVNPIKYNGISSGLSTLWREQGPSSLWRVHLLKYLLMWLSVLSKLSKFVFKHSLVLRRAWLMGFRNFMQLKGLRAFTRDSFHSGVEIFHIFQVVAFQFRRHVSMIMFSTFEHSVELIYHNIIQRRKEDCSRAQQLSVTCLAGYAAGAVGTVISNPADNIVASLYNKQSENVLQAVKKIGLVNLFTRSLPVRFLLVGPVVTSQWFFYDTIKVLSGLPTSGGLRRRVEEANVSA